MTAVVTRVPAQQQTHYRDLLLSEWTKLRSVRSTYWTAIVAVLSTVALGAAICARFVTEINENKQSVDGFDSTLTSLNGMYLAQVAFGALGVLVISSEYGTGMIRATLTAVPQRRLALAAKGAVFAAFTFLAGEIMSFAAFGIGQAILAHAHSPSAPSVVVGASLSDPGALRAVFGAGLYLTAVGLLGFGLGATIRHTAGAISALFGILFALVALVDLLPTSWRNDVINYLPANAGSQILTRYQTAGALSPWTGLAVLALYAAVAIGIGLVLIERRDV